MKVIWFTGLSGAGKSTIAEALAEHLSTQSLKPVLLDGDVMRTGLCADLGFDAGSRTENIRRLIEVARLFQQHGHYVLVPAITPFESSRQKARERIGNDNFILVHVSTTLEECEKRDVKGLYKKARAGEIPDFTGIDSAFHNPKDADLTIDTKGKTVTDCVKVILDEIHRRWSYSI
jgi:adenylyl-sulfate kinase